MNQTATHTLGVDVGALLPRPGRTTDRTLSLMHATLAGLVGHVDDPRLATWLPQMSWRWHHRDVTTLDLLRLHSRTGGNERPLDVAVYVHGLFIDEQNFTLGPDPLPRQLERHFGWRTLLVRYNTGQHVSHNGEALAELLDELHETWGPRLGRVQLFGHSMGGLVARSALDILHRRGSAALEHVERMFLLATPNHGAELEKLGHVLEYALRRTRRLHTGTVHGLLRMRSDGIRDVRHGYLRREEWESDEHARRLMLNHKRPVPPPPGVRTYAVAGSLWVDVGSAPSRLRNDGLVSVASAAGTGGPFDDLGVVDAGRFAEVPMLVHQLAATSARVGGRIRHWVEHDL